MIDLCIDARMARSSGIGTCIRHIAPRLNQRPFKVRVLVDQLDQEWCKDLDQILMAAPIYSIQEQWFFLSKIPRCDLFWSPHYNVPLLPIRAKKKVATIHDACHLALSKLLSIPERIYARLVMRHAFHRSDAVVTDSQFSQGELIRYLGRPKRPIEVIYPAIDFKLYQPGRGQEIFRKYDLPDKFILYVGNLKPHKNLAGLLKAFSLASLGGAALVVVGKSRGLRNFEEIEQKNNIRYVGEISDEDLSALYGMARMLILPSFYEGFGLPPLEAMGCGCPTIVSDRGSLPEICGNASLYVDPDQPREIAACMERLDLNETLRCELIEKGKERVKDFTWDKTAESYRVLFEKACRS